MNSVHTDSHSASERKTSANSIAQKVARELTHHDYDNARSDIKKEVSKQPRLFDSIIKKINADLRRQHENPLSLQRDTRGSITHIDFEAQDIYSRSASGASSESSNGGAKVRSGTPSVGDKSKPAPQAESAPSKSDSPPKTPDLVDKPGAAQQSKPEQTNTPDQKGKPDEPDAPKSTDGPSVISGEHPPQNIDVQKTAHNIRQDLECMMHNDFVSDDFENCKEEIQDKLRILTPDDQHRVGEQIKNDNSHFDTSPTVSVSFTEDGKSIRLIEADPALLDIFAVTRGTGKGQFEHKNIGLAVNPIK